MSRSRHKGTRFMRPQRDPRPHASYSWKLQGPHPSGRRGNRFSPRHGTPLNAEPSTQHPQPSIGRRHRYPAEFCLPPHQRTISSIGTEIDSAVSLPRPPPGSSPSAPATTRAAPYLVVWAAIFPIQTIVTSQACRAPMHAETTVKGDTRFPLVQPTSATSEGIALHKTDHKAAGSVGQ